MYDKCDDYAGGHPLLKLPDRAVFVADMWKIQQSINPESVVIVGFARPSVGVARTNAVLVVRLHRPAKHFHCRVCAPFDYPCLMFDCTTLGIPKDQCYLRVDDPPSDAPVLQGTAHSDRVLIKKAAARYAISSFVGAPAGGRVLRRTKSRKRVADDSKEEDRERLTVRASVFVCLCGPDVRGELNCRFRTLHWLRARSSLPRRWPNYLPT